MTDFAELRFRPNLLGELGLPDVPYPVPVDLLSDVLSADGGLPLAVLLLGLQRRSAADTGRWRDDEPAMDRLATLLAPPGDATTVIVEGATWWVEIGPVDLTGEIVTIQRQDALIAAFSPRQDGRLRVAAYRPLDARSARDVAALADHCCSMRDNNWEYALDSSAGMGNVYASMEGDAYLSYWQLGLGLSSDGSVVETYHAQRSLRARRPDVVAVELRLADHFKDVKG